MQLEYKVIVDLARENDVTIMIPKGDAYSRKIFFNILNNGSAFDMSDVIGGGVKAVKPDNTIVYNDIDEITDSGVVVYTIPPQLTTVAGECSMDVDLFDSEGRTLTSFSFVCVIKNSVFDAKDLVSVDDISAIKSYLARTLNAAKSAEEIEDAIETAYGKLEDIGSDFKEELQDYIAYLADLKERVASGEFNGARGAQGENGHDGVIATEDGIIGFQIVDGDLLCYCFDGIEPTLRINENGELLIELE